MNRIYNVIWSKTKKCYVVVSEIVRGEGKAKTTYSEGSLPIRLGALMAATALLLGSSLTPVQGAAIIINDIDNYGYARGQQGGSQWSYLYNYNNPGNRNALDGSYSTGYYSNNQLTGISIGRHTNIAETSDPSYYSGVAIGDYAQATGGLAFSIGNYAQATNRSSMALGTATLSKGFNSLAMMRQAAATGDFSTAIGTASWANGSGSFAMGYSAQAKGNQSIAIGAAEPITVAGSGAEPSAQYNGASNTVTEGARSLAFGTKARTADGADDSMAFGSNAKTHAANSVAMGNGSRTWGADAFAIGNTAYASGEGSTALGKSAKSKGKDSIAMGSSSQAMKVNAIALGGSAQALEEDALALGGASNASAKGTMAIGSKASATSENATAIGKEASVAGSNSMAIGYKAVANANNSLALGSGTEVKGTLTNGYSAFTNEINDNVNHGVVAVGNVTSERRIINVAGGEKDTDATNVKQLRYVNNNLAQTIAGPSYTGYESNGSTYKAPDFAIKNTTYHTVKEAVEAAQTNFFSTNGTSTDANYDNTGATGTHATAAGVGATASGANATAMGASASATAQDGVALGSHSVASTAAGQTGYDVKTTDNRANGYAGLTGAAATSSLGAVSIGQAATATAPAATRQIINLAAGTEDTDAVNVAQLRNVNLKIAGNTNANNGKNDVLLDSQTLTIKGDGSYVTTKADGQTVLVTLTDATKNKIDSGLKFDANQGGAKTNKLGSKVTIKGDGANIITKISQDGNGDSTINVNLGKDITAESLTATGAPGQAGKVGINGKDGVTTNISVSRDGQPGIDGAAGTTTTRLVYEKPDGTTEEVATLNDGLAFKGDMGATSKVKLNKLVNVTGGITNAADLATGNNIGVTSAAVDGSGNASLQLQLAKDLSGLRSVTVSDTVKAGTATVGKQTATDNKGGNQTGNFVTGLDNTSWNMSNPVFVPGRAATEDQLKVVSDAVRAANAGSGDYHLIANPANTTDGSYKVINNQVDLTVKDEKSGDAKTVTIKDVASKTELDKLKDRSVKYDLDGSGNPDTSKVTYEGPTYTNKTGGTHVSNVAYATGNDGSEAVNVDYLNDKIKDASDDLINKGLKFDANQGGVKTNKLGSKVTVKGEGNRADANYSGDNIKTFIDQDGAGNTSITVKMDKNIIADSIKVNKDGRDGKDGVSITGPTGQVGQAGNNGKIGITGADGKDAVSISGKDGVGYIGLTGPAGTNGVNGTNGIDMTVKNGYDDAAKGVKGEKGIDGVDGITRIVYTDKTGEHQVATMEDGMLYGGDSGTVIKKKLNNQVNVKGGITDASKLSTEDNVGVVSDGSDTLRVRLAKDLKGLDSVTANNTVKASTVTMGKQEAIKADGSHETGNYVTGLDNTSWDPNNIVSGRAATEDQLKAAIANQAASGKLKFNANVGGLKTNSLGSTITVQGEGNQADTNYSGDNIKTFIDQDGAGNTRITVKMDKNIIADSIKVNKDGRDGKDGVTITGPTGQAGQDGNNGKIGITGADGKDAVSISGKDGVGHIGLTGPAGTNGVNGTNGIDMTVKNGYDDAAKGVKGEKGVDGVDGITRIVYTDRTGEHQVATMDDGMLYGGDSGAVIKKKLNNQVNVKGGIADPNKLSTEDNLGVVSDGSDTLKVRLAKDLKGLNSTTFSNGTNGNTVVNGGGMSINDAAGNPLTSITKDGVTITNGPSLTTGGIDAGSKKITNVADGRVASGSKDAINGGQLHDAVESIKTNAFGLKAEDGQSIKKNLGQVIDVKGDGNVKTSIDNGAVKVALNDRVTLGTDPSKQIKLDGSTGNITAGNTVKAGDVILGNQSSGGQNGNFVTGLDNKTWDPANPSAVTGRAATEDQLKAVNDDLNSRITGGRIFQGDQAGAAGKVVRALGDTLNLKGGADVSKLTDNNIAVLKNTADDGYDIKLAKNLMMGDGSTSYTKPIGGNQSNPYTVNTRVDGGGITITPSINGNPLPGHTVSLTEKGLDNGNNTITNVAPGINGTDGVNVNQLTRAIGNVDNKIADVGAASAAMAGLKPLQYDPLEPTQILAAVGNYKGSTAAAIGLAHYTNESTMLHMGLSLGGHDNMVNAGISYKFGSSDAKKAIPDRYKAGPISSAYVLQDEVTALKAENQRMKERDMELSAKYDQVQKDNEEMKAQIALLMKQVGLVK